MFLYLSIIGVASVLLMVLNISFGTSVFGYSPTWVILAVIIAVAFEFVIDLIFAGCVKIMPSKWFEMDKKCFEVSRKERNFYEKIKIKSWKDKVWELGGVGGFRKNKIKDPNSPEYLHMFIIESNKGIVTHILGIFAGFLVILFLPLRYWLVISLPVAIVNSFLSTLPISSHTLLLCNHTWKNKDSKREKEWLKSFQFCVTI